MIQWITCIKELRRYFLFRGDTSESTSSIKIQVGVLAQSEHGKSDSSISTQLTRLDQWP
jgi:hypothetical protein